MGVAQERRRHLTVATVGHYGGGKSTVLGHLLTVAGESRHRESAQMAARGEDTNAKESSGEVERDTNDITPHTVNYAWVRSTTTSHCVGIRHTHAGWTAANVRTVDANVLNARCVRDTAERGRSDAPRRRWVRV